MEQFDVERILKRLGDDFPAISNAIAGGSRTRYDNPNEPLLGVYLKPDELTLALFDRFRETEWLISYTIGYVVEVNPFVAREYATVGFVPSVPSTLPEIAYHATAAHDEDSVGTKGISIGALVGKESRGRFPNSRYYVLK